MAPVKKPFPGLADPVSDQTPIPFQPIDTAGDPV
jgi:hypothetical protein